MSQFFRFFPRIQYNFGDQENTDTIQNISIYSNVTDQVINNASIYNNYFIQPGQQPYQVSQALYGSTAYHWTFFLMNPSIRRSGWPLSPEKVYEKAQEDYSTYVINVREILFNKFRNREVIRGVRSGNRATVTTKNTNLGQIFVEPFEDSYSFNRIPENDIIRIELENRRTLVKPNDWLINEQRIDQSNIIINNSIAEIRGNYNLPSYNVSVIGADRLFFEEGEVIENINNSLENSVVHSFEQQYNTVHHYEDENGVWVDVDPSIGPMGLINEVTWFERLNRINEESRSIRVIRPSLIDEVIRSFRDSIRQ